MSAQCLIVAVCLLTPMQGPEPEGKISGIVLNGTAGRVPLAICPIVLRASRQGNFETIAETTSDSNGRFSFTGLAVDENVIYLPGANRNDVHYPGTRVRLMPREPKAEVRLIAYDAITAPSPLVTRRHQIDVRPDAEFIAVEETLVIDNPTLTTFIGRSVDDQTPVTLQISLPEQLETVTFEREFHGRNFQLAGKTLTTDIPWRPGKQELRFMYRLPADHNHKLFVRLLDRPTDQVLVHVVSTDTSRLACNLPRAKGNSARDATFEHRETEAALPAGYAIELQLGTLPIGFATYGRWSAVLVFGASILATVAVTRRRYRNRRTQAEGDESAHRNKPSQRPARSTVAIIEVDI